MKKKRICFIAQFPPPIHGLSKAVDTLYNSDIKYEFELEKVDITNNKQFIRNLIKIIKSKADLFYFTISQTKGGNLRDLIIFKSLSLQHKKCLIHLHGGYYRTLVDSDLSKWQRKANYKAISKVAGAIVLGSSLKWIFEGMLPNERIFTVPNCVDDKYLMDDESFKKKIDNQKNKTIKDVLYLSNFIKAKGYPEVLELAKFEKEKVESGKEQKLQFHFAGKFFNEDDRMFFQEYVRKNELEKYVIYHGIVSGNEKRSLLNQCDIFVLLTRYPNEGQPISILEAMGNGMMVVTTDHAGIPDIVKDGINGIVVTKANMKLESLYLKVKNSYTSFSMVNRNMVLDKYSENNYVRNMESVFSNYVNED